MAYLEQLIAQRRQPDEFGRLFGAVGQSGASLLQGVASIQQQERQEQDRQRKLAADRAQALHGQGRSLLLGRDDAGAAALAPEYARSFNQAYDAHLPVREIKGGLTQPRAEQLGPALPGSKMPEVNVGAPVRNFDNPQTRSALYGTFGVEPPKLVVTSPGASLFDPIAGKSVFTAPYPENPNRLTAEEQVALRREGWDAALERAKYLANATGQRQTASFQHADQAQGRQFEHADAMQGRSLAAAEDRQLLGLDAADMRQDKQIGAAATRQDKAIKAAQDRIDHKRRIGDAQASGLVARVIAEEFPGAGVHGVEGDDFRIKLNMLPEVRGGPSAADLAGLRARAVELGYDFVPGKTGEASYLVPAAAPDLSSLRQQARPKGNVWARGKDGTETRVRDGVGVTRAPKKPAGQKMPNFTRDAIAVFKTRYPNSYPGTQAEKREELNLIEETLVAKWKQRQSGRPRQPLMLESARDGEPTPSGITADDLLRAAETLRAEQERSSRINRNNRGSK